MLFNNLLVGSEVEILFEIGSNHFRLTTTIVATNQLAMIEINGVPLHLRSSMCNRMMFTWKSTSSGRTHYWTDISMTPVNDEYYEVLVEDDSKQINRREAVRVPINIPTTCNISNISSSIACDVLDLSVSGVAIGFSTVRDDIESLVHRTASMSFTDTSPRAVFDITAEILYVIQATDTYVKCGCKILSCKPSPNYYLNLKQLRRLNRFTNHATRQKIGTT